VLTPAGGAGDVLATGEAAGPTGAGAGVGEGVDGAVGSSTTTGVGAGVRAKAAPTVRAAAIVTWQVRAVPEQAPLQPANAESDAGPAVSVTTVPRTYEAEHVAPQSSLPPAAVTVPLPAPDFETVSVCSISANAAVTLRA